MPPAYIVRLDDACPTMDLNAWARMERVLVEHAIRPIVAIVPDNRDPDLIRNPPDPRFWHRARQWQTAGWTIAQHGYQHVYVTKEPGLVAINRFSEFAGLPLEAQNAKLAAGYTALVKHGLRPKVWVAPGHSFDQNTLRALRRDTEIRMISDGFALYPFEQDGFSWLPQQLWRYRWFPFGVWTICLHPNDMTSAQVIGLERAIARRRHRFIAVEDALDLARSRGRLDRWVGHSFHSWLRVRRLLRRQHAGGS